MTEATTPDDKNEITVAQQLETIGDEFGVHREDDEADEVYAERIVDALNELIDGLVETQGTVHALVA